MEKTVSVIGGGLGGLAGAIRLAKSGFNVQLYEKNRSLGGKMNEIKANGYRFDTGPTLVTMPFVLKELFEFSGFSFEEYINLVMVDPICRYFFPDGTVFDASSDMNKMLAAIESISPVDVENYKRFYDYSQRIYDITADLFMFSALHEPEILLNRRTLLKLLKVNQIDPFRTVDKAVRSFFKDERLVQIFNRYSTYNGSDPFQAPATLNIIPFVEYGLGGYYIKGGLYRLVETLEHIALQLGVRIYKETSVERILHKNNQISGIKVDGETVASDYVVCNADIVYTFNHLIAEKPEITRKMNRFEPSLSGLVFLWGMKNDVLMLKHHNIFFSESYRNEFIDIFDRKTAPDDPTVYISISSKQDVDHAPPGKMNAFILINMPYLNSNLDWMHIEKEMRNKIYKKFQMLDMDVQGQIEFDKVITPQMFCDMYHSNRGSIYGISSNNKSMAFKRPANRNRQIDGLYFCGGSVHPGGGVPLALLSGKLVSELIVKRSGKEKRKT